jgi:small GTP-binding protein
MNLAEYEGVKFELADVLRSASAKARAVRPKELYPFEDLFSRLADDRFNIVVVGQFSRGKTSLMNAMLNTERLPTGIVPLTSVITTVQYGTHERAVLEYDENRLPRNIPLEELENHITQRRNPGNEQGIRYARIELPAEVLRRGFYLVDTPGLGSAIIENTRTTQGFLPEADAIILVTSYDSPLSSEEAGVLQSWSTRGCKAFVVINKQDLATAAERLEARDHVSAQVDRLPGMPETEVFSLSARNAIEANRTRDSELWAASGVSAFMAALTSFLISEKQAAFLKRMADRISDRLVELGGCTAELDRLAKLCPQLDVTRPDGSLAKRLPSLDGQHTTPSFADCFVCSRIDQEIYDFLRHYQYQIAINAQVQQELAEGGGLCPFHTWQYAAIASPHGTCSGFPGVLERQAAALEALASGRDDDLLNADPACALCKVQARAEASAVQDACRLIEQAANGHNAALPLVCLTHTRRLATAVSDHVVVGKFVKWQAASWGRVAEDMRRYALKRDGSRRAFTSEDEENAHRRGLLALAGHPRLKFERTRN